MLYLCLWSFFCTKAKASTKTDTYLTSQRWKGLKLCPKKRVFTPSFMSQSYRLSGMP